MKSIKQAAFDHRRSLITLLAGGCTLIAPTAGFAGPVTYGPFTSIQVNVDPFGQNIPGDMGNEPSIAINPVDKFNMVIGWRQRPAGSSLISGGNAHTFNAGASWSVAAPLPALANQKRTDPALDVDSEGNFYFQSLATGGGAPDATQVFKSVDGGVSWDGGVYQFSGDRNFIAVDRSGGVGEGNIYGTWSGDTNPDPNYVPTYFVRSIDRGSSYQQPAEVLPAYIGFGRMTVGPEGNVYISGRDWLSDIGLPGTVYENYYFLKSVNAKDPGQSPSFTARIVDMGGKPVDLGINNPNPRGGINEVEIAVDHSQNASRGNIYLMTNLLPNGYQTCDPNDPEICEITGDIMDLHLIRSSDGGTTWSAPVRINDDPPKTTSIQWFPMLGVAPNSRIDAVWYDTRNGDGDKPYKTSQLFYSYSWDGGLSWSPNRAVTQPFNTHMPYTPGTENQKDKLGDYAQLISDANGAHVAYAATFNGEQDVYYLNVFPDCNNNAVSDVADIQQRRSGDTNANHLPDSCENITVTGDIDGDKDVDQLDLNLVLAARNKPASGPNDPRDLDGNGTINANDARRLTVLCTRPRCAV